MAERTLRDLPSCVSNLVFETLRVFVQDGPRGLAARGLFPEDQVAVAEERCMDFGGRFRLPPSSATVYVYRRDELYDLELPLWLEGEEESSDLFMFLEVDPGSGIARMVDLRAP